MARPPAKPVRAPAPPKPTARARQLERELREAVLEARVLRARAGLRRLKESAALNYDWVGPWAALLDQRARGDGWLPIGSASARRHGTNFPFYQTEQELAVIRDLSRIVAQTNGNAIGLLRGYGAFAVGTGFKTKVSAKAGADPEAGKAAAARVTSWLDGWARQNRWAERQQELFRRTERDGDGIVRLFPDDGCLKLRFVWPEQLTQPPGATFAEWSFGIKWEPGDCERVEAVYVADLDDPARGEEVPGDEIVMFQPELDAGVKRRLPLFSFQTREALDAAGRLTRNLGEGAAVREAIAFMRQHSGAGEAEVQAFNDAGSAFRETAPFREVSRPVSVWEPGTVVDFPEGMEHAGAPQNPGTQAHSAVVDLLIRSACARINAPEWLGSSNAANMGAYTSSLVAESPFVKGIALTQGYYRDRLLGIVERALALAAASGLVRRDDLELVAVDLVPPSPEVRDKAAEAQRASIEIPLGVDSRQRYCESQDRDYEQIAKDNAAYQEEFGGDGQELPTDAPPDDGTGGDGGAGAGTKVDPGDPLGGLTEALLEGLADADEVTVRPLLEAGARKAAPPGKMWKTITYTKGGTQVSYQRLVNAPAGAAGKAAPAQPAGGQKKAAGKAQPAAKPAKPAPAPKPPTKTQQKQQAQAAAVAALAPMAQQLRAGGALRPADLAALPGHLAQLSAAQLAAFKAQVGAKASGAKAALVQKLVQHATAQTQRVTSPPPPPAPPPPPPPSKAQVKAQTQAASHAAADTAMAAVNSGQPLSAADLAALPGHLANLTVAQIGALRAKHRLGSALGNAGTKAQQIQRVIRTVQASHQWNQTQQQVAAAQAQQRAAAAANPPPPIAPPPPPPPVAAPQQPAQGQQPAGATGQPPGGPPRPGLVWDPNSHRWVLPADGGVFGAYTPAPGQKVSSADGDRMALNNLVDRSLVAAGMTATDALKQGMAGQIAASLARYTDGSVGAFEVNRALKQHAALEATVVIAPLHAVPGGRNGPNPNLPDGTRPTGLATADKVALQKYTTAVYGPLNKGLRDTGAPPAALTDLHRDLQSAFAKAPVLAQPIDAVRGLTIAPADLSGFLNQFKPGQNTTLAGYQSTTPGTQLDPFFKGNVQLNLKVRQGIDLSPHTHYAGSPAQEMLLNHGSQFRVHAVRTVGGVTHIDLEQVVAGQQPTQQAGGLWSRFKRTVGLGGTQAAAPATAPPLGDTRKTGVAPAVLAIPAVRAIVSNPTLAQRLRSTANQWQVTGEDATGTALSKHLGTDAAPQVVTKAQMDGFKRQGWLVGYRGVGQAAFHDNHRTGPLWTGTGLYGVGTYVALGTGPDPSGDALHTAKNFGSHVTRFALPPTAKVVRADALEAEQDADLKALDKEHQGGKITQAEYNAVRGVLADKGRYAMLKGYDAIRTGGSNYLIIVSRKATTMQDSNL